MLKDWNGHKSIFNNCKQYYLIGPTVNGITKVNFSNGKDARETFFEGSTDFITENPCAKGKIYEDSFPIGSILCYGKTAAIILRDATKINSTFGLYDMKNHKFVPNEAMSFQSLMANGSPFSDFNKEAFYALCDDPKNFVELVLAKENNYELSDDGKVMFFDLANRIINLQKDNALKEISNALYGETNNNKKGTAQPQSGN